MNDEEHTRLLAAIAYLLGLVASLRAEAHIARGSAKPPITKPLT